MANHGEQTHHDRDRPGDEQDLVPAALMGQQGPHDLWLRAVFPIACHSTIEVARMHVASSAPPIRTSKVTMSSLRTQVEETIEAIRPALQADGGDIELKGVDETTGIVSVTLVGACGTCPASTQTLKDGIERIMRDRVDGVTEVVNV